MGGGLQSTRTMFFYTVVSNEISIPDATLHLQVNVRVQVGTPPVGLSSLTHTSLLDVRVESSSVSLCKVFSHSAEMKSRSWRGGLRELVPQCLPLLSKDAYHPC